MDTKPGFKAYIDNNKVVNIPKKAKTLPEVVEDMGKIAAEWGGITESIRRLDKEGRIREMDVIIKFKAV